MQRYSTIWERYSKHTQDKEPYRARNEYKRLALWYRNVWVRQKLQLRQDSRFPTTSSPSYANTFKLHILTYLLYMAIYLNFGPANPAQFDSIRLTRLAYYTRGRHPICLVKRFDKSIQNPLTTECRWLFVQEKNGWLIVLPSTSTKNNEPFPCDWRLETLLS